MVREFPLGPDSITAHWFASPADTPVKPCSIWAAATAHTARNLLGKDYERSGATSIKSICVMLFATVCP